MNDQVQPTVGVTRDATGTIVNPPAPSPTTPPTPTPTTTLPEPSSTSSTTTTSEPSGDKSLLNDGKTEPATAPETYADFTVPEGFTLDSEVAKEASTIFKSLNLPQEGAQKLVDFWVSKTQEAFKAPIEAYTALRTEWRGQAEAHTDITSARSADGKLSGLAQVKVVVGRAIDGLGDAQLARDFRAAMDLTGAGDHPAFIRAFYKLAQRSGEGQPVPGNRPSQHGQGNQGRPASAASALYPHLPSAG